MRSRAVIAVAIALGLGGCGADSLSVSQLHAEAAQICGVAQQRTARIPTPRVPGDAPRYLRGGILALTPELARLRALRPPADLARPYRDALRASAREVSALRSTLKGLDAGNDPVVAIKSLERQLRPLERRADRAWPAVGVAQCADG